MGVCVECQILVPNTITEEIEKFMKASFLSVEILNPVGRILQTAQYVLIDDEEYEG